MSKRLASLAMMAAVAMGSLSSGIAEAGWHMDNARPSRPQPRPTSKSTHKQNARKAKKGK
jgi:hypothetical protein